MVFVTDKSVKKLLIDQTKEQLEDLRLMYNIGTWTKEEYALRKTRLSDKIKLIKAGKYEL